MTITELGKAFLEHKRKRVKLATINLYAHRISRQIAPYFGDEDISGGIDNKRANEFAEKILERYSVKSAMDINTVLVSMFSFGSYEFDIPFKPWKIHWPSKNLQAMKKIEYFTKAECKKVFDEMEVDPSPGLLGIVIGLTTGMRIGELCGLRFSDMDWESKTIHVQRTVERIHDYMGDTDFDKVEKSERIYSKKNIKSRVVVSTPKTADSNRIVPVAKLPYNWIKKYSKVVGSQEAYILSLSTCANEPRSYREFYYRTLEKLGLPRLNPHCMRHTFATQMLQNKVDVATIAAILGHSSPAITLEIYSHTNEDEKAKAVKNVFGKMF
jgi:integrase